MLTSKLVRATMRKGVVKPRYIDPDDPELNGIADRLIAVFVQADAAVPKWSRGEIEEAVADCVSERADPVLFQGFTKLLMDRADFETAAGVDPVAVRRALFERAAESPQRREPGRPWRTKRAEIVAAVAAELDLAVSVVEESLFADLNARQRLSKFRPMTTEALLARYNLALAQGVLIRARKLTIRLKKARVGAYRQLFRALKFHQLIHTVAGEADGSYTIELDGPLSLFSSATRYGLAMARFFPTLVLLDGWTLEAEVTWGQQKKDAVFAVNAKIGLQSHLKKRGQYVTEEQKWFEERFKKKARAWSMARTSEILRTKGGDVVVPDLVFENEETGETRYLEIIGFWRAGSLEKRLAMLEDPALTGLVLAVSKRLAGDKHNPPEHPRIVWFSQVISAPEVIERLAL